MRLHTLPTMWHTLPLSPAELSLAKVLRCGQTFRWHHINGVWLFALADRVVLLKQDANTLYYSQVMRQADPDAEGTLAFITDYFNLDVKLEPLYRHWETQHAKYPSKSALPFTRFPGIRILRQDPWETTVLFICLSNNNVKRILKMCDALCVNFGHKVAEYDGHTFYSFPRPQELAASDVEARLRKLGFGYRAKYIHQTAKLMTLTHSVERLEALRGDPYEDAHEYLLELSGVGPKVADCICLMALDKHHVVPVDTHVYQIALRDYRYKGKRDVKTLSKPMYQGIRQHFIDIFGDYAGWAQSVLFASDLSDLNNGINVVAAVKQEDIEIKKEASPIVKSVAKEASEIQA